MANYVKFKYSIIQKKGIKTSSAYTALLADIKYCIYFLEELESDRGYKECVSDGAVGETSSLNIDRTRNNLNKLHELIQKGLEHHTNLFCLIDKAKLIQQSLKLRIDTIGNSGMDTSLLMITYNNISSTNKEFYTRVSTAIEQLEITGIFVKKKFKTNKTAAAMGIAAAAAGTAGAVGVGIGVVTAVGTAGAVIAGAAGGVALVAVAIGIIYLVARSYGEKKGLKFQELIFLSESLHDVRILAEFESLNFALDKIMIKFKENIEFYETEVANIQSLVISTKAQPLSNAPTNNQPTVDDGIQATRIYDKTLQENIQSLQESEPDMSEEMRERMATKLAETACKTFLNVKLNYSEREVGEFLRKITI